MSAPVVVVRAVADHAAGGFADAARQAAPQAAPVAARQATRGEGADGDSRHRAALRRVAISPRSPRHIEVGT